MKFRLDHMFVLLCAVGVVLFYFLGQGSYLLVLFANYGLIAFAGLAGVFGLIAFAKLGKSTMGLVSLGFAIGLLSWMLGLVVYTYTYLVANADLPYLSLADVFYFISYPPIILGCIGLLRFFWPSSGRIGLLLTAIAGGLLCFAVVTYAVVPSIQALDNVLEIVVTALYPLLDVLILVLLLPLFLAFRKGIFGTAYALLALGAALEAVGDLVFTYVNLAVGYYDGHPLDLLWFLGFISYAYGFWRQHAGFDLPE